MWLPTPKVLALGNNQFEQGNLPKEIGNLRHLTVLALPNMGLVGTPRLAGTSFMHHESLTYLAHASRILQAKFRGKP